MATSIPWSENWGRTYKITVGVREYIEKGEIVTVLPPLMYNSDRTFTDQQCTFVPSDAVSFDNLTDERGFTFEFESQQVASSKGASTENSYLMLYNITVDIERLLSTPNCIVLIEAGYEGKTVLAYTGDVVGFTPSKNGADWKYKIQLAAAGNSMRNTMINTSFSEDMSALDVLVQTTREMPDISLATYGKLGLKDKKKTGGWHATGVLMEYFDTFMHKNNLEYSITNNKMYVIPYRLTGEDYDDFARTNYTLSERSVIQVAPIADYTKKSSDDAQNNVVKVNINTFYLPIEVGQLVTIPYTDDLKKYAGTYIVKGRRVKLQSKGSAWNVVLNAESIPK